MPMYEYECRSCEHMFEELVRGDERIACPKCRSTKLNKLFSVPARPYTATAEMPMACKSTGPPCGAMCSRFKNN